MNPLVFPPRILAAAVSLLAGSACFAQLPSLGGGSGAPGADMAALSKLFASHPAFTAKSEIRVYDKNQKETINTPMDFAYLDTKIRLDIDVTQMKNKDLPPGVADQLKQFGMERVVTIVRPDKKSVYLIYPKLESYVTLPMPKEDADATAKTKVDKEAIGKETLDGHACVKNKVTFTSEKGQKQELTVWNASDLKDFPVQILTKQDQDTVITRYKQVQFTKPDAKLFDPPAGFKEYSDMQEFMQAAMTKAFGGGGAVPAK